MRNPVDGASRSRGSDLPTWWRTRFLSGPAWAVAGPVGAARRAVSAWTRRHVVVADTSLALLVLVCVTPQLVFHARTNNPSFGLYLGGSLLLVVPLIWRRRHPVSTFAVVAVVALVLWFLDIRLAAEASLLLCLFTVAARYPMRVACLAAGICGVGAALTAARGPNGLSPVDAFAILSAFILATLMSGAYVRNRREAVAELTERAARLGRERDQQAVIAAERERTRIAREMHDVIAHSLSVMITFSDAAALKAQRHPDRAADAMRQVSATGREALDETRRLLGVLRADGDVGRRPQPGIGDVDELVERLRTAGLVAELTRTGEMDAVPPGIGVTVYRVAREAVTNVLKHAGPVTTVRVDIAVEGEAVTILVRDDGRGTGPDRQGDGRGLLGMRERVALHGGSVRAGPDPQGGWTVRARLPWDGAPARAEGDR